MAKAAAESDVLERVVVTDLDLTRAQAAVERCSDARFVAYALDASDAGAISELARQERADVVVNACDPRLNPAIFAAAFDAGCNYLDMAMTLSEPHPERPYEIPGVLLGAEQFAADARWQERGLLALVGMGVEPGLSDVFARYAADHLFSEVDQVGVRDGSDLVIEGFDFAPTFSVWTTIEECLNPPLVWEQDRGVFTTAPFSEPETFVFPAGIGPARMRQRRARRGAADPAPRRRAGASRSSTGSATSSSRCCACSAKTGLASTAPVRVRGVDVSPRDLVAAVLPDPASLGDRMHGRTCAGTWVTGTGVDGTAARGVPVPRVRQRRDDGAPRCAGRRVANRDQPGGRARADGHRSVAAAPECSAPKPSTRSRSSTASAPAARSGTSTTASRRPRRVSSWTGISRRSTSPGCGRRSTTRS